MTQTVPLEDLANVLQRIKSELQCCICLGLWESPQRTPCGHTFCKYCIEMSMKRSNLCPLCKTSVKKRAICDNTRAKSMCESFKALRDSFEGEYQVGLSQAPIQREWKNEPLSNLSQLFPYPAKPSKKAKKQISKNSESLKNICEEEEPHVLNREEISGSREASTQMLAGTLPQGTNLAADISGHQIPENDVSSSDIPLGNIAHDNSDITSVKQIDIQTQNAKVMETPISTARNSLAELTQKTEIDQPTPSKISTPVDLSTQAINALRNQISVQNDAFVILDSERTNIEQNFVPDSLPSNTEQLNSEEPLNVVLPTQKLSTPKAKKVIVLFSSLSPSKLDKAERIAAELNWSVRKSFSEDVTHLVTHPVSSNGGARRTLKYFQCVSHGKWVVDYRWLLQCERMKRVVDPSQYELKGCEEFLNGGPEKSRKIPKITSHLPLADVSIIFEGTYKGIGSKDFDFLAKSMGATVYSDISFLLNSQNSLKIIIIGLETTKHGIQDIIKTYSGEDVKVISAAWILDCISSYHALDPKDYRYKLNQ